MEERRMEDKTRMIHKVYLNARKSAVLSGVPKRCQCEFL